MVWDREIILTALADYYGKDLDAFKEDLEKNFTTGILSDDTSSWGDCDDLFSCLKRGLLLDLAVALLPSVDKEEIDLLFIAIKSPLQVNRKTRNRAYDLLVEIGHACGDEEQGGKKENLLNFFHMIVGGLACEKPHMISAAIKGLAHLAYEFSDLISAAYNLLPSSFLLLQRKIREIIKVNLGLIKVLVAKSEAEGLQMHLGMMVEGLLK